MRERKYRAWVKEKSYFLPVFEIDFHAKMVGVWDCGKEDCGLCDNYLFFHEVEIIEYTGLKDKNGVEIFEGDIIGLDGFWSYCIDFHDGAFRKIPCNQAQKLNWPWNPLEKVTIEVHGWEVIGNRYENPELLKEEPTC